MYKKFCDRCGEEIERVCGLDYPDVKTKFPMKKSKKKFPVTEDIYELDVCDNCKEEFKVVVNNYLNKK